MKYQNGFSHIELETILEPYNPWWKSAQFDTIPFKRPIFHKIYKDLFTLKQIISITGPRRVGKTTLLKQIIKELINVNQVEPIQIIYFSFDDPLMVETHIRERFFDNLIRWADTKLKDKTVYFFLDEIQRFEKWELYLKKYYDLGFSCRFIISGSTGSTPKAKAGNPSVTRFTQRICIGSKGSGKPISEETNITSISPVLQDRR